MKVSVIGTGYVGLVSGTCFAEMGHHVTCIDIDAAKVEKLKEGKSPIYEPGLNEILERNIKNKRLNFSTSYESIPESEVVFLAIQTPEGEDGSADLKYFKAAVEMAAPFLKDDLIMVIKSTVPIGSHKKVEAWIKEVSDKKVHVVNNPEFLKEGAAVADFLKPDRVVIGHNNNFAAERMKKLYEPLMIQGNPIFLMSNLSAEMTKYAANCFLATKISFINEIARLCDLTGSDIEEVRKGITSDKRIGNHFLYPGAGYGGSCFPKDVKALIHTGREAGCELKIVQAADDVNNKQKTLMFEKIQKHFNNEISGKTFAFWGAAFKPNTDDIREAPAIYMAKEIVKNGGKVQFYDPVASDNFLNYMKENSVEVKSFDNKYDCLNDCDGLVLMTEWNEFRTPDYEEIKSRLRTSVVFDARNIFQDKVLKEFNISYYAVGKRID